MLTNYRHGPALDFHRQEHHRPDAARQGQALHVAVVDLDLVTRCEQHVAETVGAVLGTRRPSLSCPVIPGREVAIIAW